MAATVSQFFAIANPQFIAGAPVRTGQYVPDMHAGDTFREKLQAHIDAGLSVAELARRSGVGDSTIRAILKRDGSAARIDNATAIAEALGLTLADMTADGPEPSAIVSLLSRLSPEDRKVVEDMARALARAEAGRQAP